MAKKKADIEVSESTALATVPASQAPNTLVLIQMALDKGLDPDKLGKLFDLHERDEKNKAARAYADAMNLAQAAMPAIKSDLLNKQTNSRYASVENILRTIKPALKEHGFSVSFGEADCKIAEWVRTTCDVRHKEGHVEHFHLDLPMDGKGIKGNQNMTAIHGRLSSDTYAQGRLLRKIFNLTIQDDDTDNDGNAASVIDEKGIEEINTLIEKLREYMPFDMGKFLKWCEVEDLGQIQKTNLKKVTDELNQRIKNGPAIKKQLDNWLDWFAGKPTMEELNNVLVEQFKIMDQGPVKDHCWKICREKAEEMGFTYQDGKFSPKKK